jgi:hypothetical protein
MNDPGSPVQQQGMPLLSQEEEGFLAKVQELAQRLQEPTTRHNTLGVKVQLISRDLKEAPELLLVLQSPSRRLYPLFLETLLPSLLNLLDATPPVFDAGLEEQRLRSLILELLHRLPQTEALKPHSNPLMASLMDVLTKDNEDNASLALKIIVDLHKNYKSLVEDQVQPFFDFVQEAYSNMESAVAQAFSLQESFSSSSLSDQQGKGASSMESLTEEDLTV